MGVTTVTDVRQAVREDGALATLFRSEQGGHEQVVLCQDRASGLKAVIAVHSTALGPALGGTRFHAYASDEEAVQDALDLSRGMSYKNALAGLDLGGGKAVIIGDPETLKSEQLLLAYGRFVASLGGRYVTACDVGTYVADMDVVARENKWTTGRSPEHGGAGDSSVLTAFGVFQGMRAAAQATWGEPTLRGRRVGVAGVGKVGRHLVEHLVEDGAQVVVTDVRADAVARITARHPRVTAAADVRALVRSPLDVYAPCALGHALDDPTVAALTAKVVCGAANNQLAHPGVEKDLADRGVLYAPDYVVNAGGVIQVADELQGFDFDRAKAKAARIFDTTLAIFERAAADGVPPAVAADRLAEQRMADRTPAARWGRPEEA
ncbi:Glu/Leu/Phe/Val dehydrogenase dimerization domain-containing protein [Actinacidiphila sp. DG2A-62]|jgi:valine dehydrogenase (NAD+)|uniref:Leu/Phe/Val dehydrogenase n=1 Tax=Actinacidiphila sp. DG2A-62 TaxID=3108821 RepID=UPI002DB88040|nr:Glu/Leu/Phe/Val dehydrogenase dimerization domain-containing protein [Actinacidiphila sp. DG2A-62]MEC3995096.1 Glu/Leu/Phe/Val dehydrogenase dimerization domain-containing protein [Actinacidiphila sp. DG2A-62]